MRTVTTRRSRELEELAHYVAAVHDFLPLSREEEHALAVRARGGEVKARQELVLHHLAFVVAIARKQRRGAVPLEDLIQEGNLGLMRAVKKFDPHAGTRFATYAVWWIRAFIGKHLEEARSTVRLQRGAPSRPDLSLDSVVGREDGDATFLDRVEDERPNPEQDYLKSEGDREVRSALGRVRGRIGELGWDIVGSRLENDQPRPLEEIGERWGVSRERVRHEELKTKQLLHRCLISLEADAA
jgi:RNA polymerase primary sigma factor